MKGLALLAAVGVGACSFAQPFANAFVRTGTFAGVTGSEVEPMGDRNFAVGVRANTGDSALYILNQAGAIQAARALVGFPGRAVYLRSVAVSPTGDVFTVSEADDSAISSQIYVHKYDAAGVLQWRRNYNPGSSAYETVGDAICDNAGNLLIVGHTGDSPTTSAADFAWVTRIRPNGTISFTTPLLGVLTRGTGVCVAANGTIHTVSETIFQSWYWRLNGTTGAIQANDDLPENTFIRSIATRGTQVFLAGLGTPDMLTNRPIVYAYDVATAFTNWSTYVSSPSVSGGVFNKVLVDGSGNVLAAGEIVDGAEQALLTKLNPSSGFITWNRKLGNASQQRVFAGFGIDRWNESYVSTRLIDSPSHFLRVDKIGPAGSIRGGVTFPGSLPANERPLSLAVQPRSGQFVSAGFLSTTNGSRWIGTYQQAVLANDSYLTPRNTTLNGASVYNNDRYVGDVAGFLHEATDHGSITFYNQSGQFDYVPNMGYSGPDSFRYRISKPGLPQVIATVNITVLP